MNEAAARDITSRDQAQPAATPVPSDATVRAQVEDFSFHYADGTKALKAITMPILDRKVTALIGPSGCGKSTLLRSFNRMHDLTPGNRYEGRITLLPEGTNLVGKEVDPVMVRLRVGMVFQKPTRSRSRSSRMSRPASGCGAFAAAASSRRPSRQRFAARPYGTR